MKTMRKMISTILISACMLLFLAACGAVIEERVTTGRYPHYDSIEQLALIADYVVRVEVLDERVENINILLPPRNELEDAGMNLEHYYMLFTVHRLMVLEVFQGNVNVGDIMEVRLLGGELGGQRLINLNNTELAIGDDLVLFLYASPGADGIPFMPNPSQGAYHVASSRDGAMAGDISETLESVHYRNHLTLSLGDLVHIWISNLYDTGERDEAISGVQVYTSDGEAYTLDDLRHMPPEEVLSLDITQESLQAVLDAGIVGQDRR